ncbi:MAG: class E sortase, partial [Acidimicrobiales bacterium]
PTPLRPTRLAPDLTAEDVLTAHQAPPGSPVTEPPGPVRPRRVATWLGRVGRVLIATGLLVLAFVAYQLWGTGIHHDRAQDRLREEFEAQLQASPQPSPPPTAASTPGPPAPTPASPAPAAPAAGEPVARIRIPAIGVDEVVVEGVSVGDLRAGPGHYPGTPLPGQPGNVAIAGHRTTYGAPFAEVDRLGPGDEILLETIQGTFRYQVAGQQIVRPDQVEILDDAGDDRLTLTSCHPKYSTRQRIVVTGTLSDTPAPVPPAPDDPIPGRATPGPERRLSQPSGSVVAALLWAAAAASVALVTYLAGRRWRRLPAYLLGSPLLVAMVYGFFERIAALLPANY